MKFDSSGTKQWTRLAGTTGHDLGYGAAVDGSGNIYVIGYTTDNINAVYDHIFLKKFDYSGGEQWTRLEGSDMSDYGCGIVVDKSGSIYVTGYTFGNLDGNINAGGSDVFLMKFDAACTEQ